MTQVDALDNLQELELILVQANTKGGIDLKYAESVKLARKILQRQIKIEDYAMQMLTDRANLTDMLEKLKDLIKI